MEFHFRGVMPGGEGRGNGLLSGSAGRIELRTGDLSIFRPVASGTTGLLGRYRNALERESRRHRDRDPAQGWLADLDEDDTPADGVRREARRLFKGAGHRVLSQALERVLEESASLRQVREYADGIRVDVRRGGGVAFGAGRAAEPTSEIAARFHFVVGSNPRVEMRTTLPGGIRTRVEMTLASPGMRASFSRRLSGRMNGTLAGGYEEGGDDRWVSAGLGVSF